MDQNEFERRCAKLEGNIRDIEDDINSTQNRSNEVANKIDHTLAKSVGDTKVQDLLDKLVKLKGDVGTVEQKLNSEVKDKDANREDLLNKSKNVSGLKLQEIKPDLLQRSLDDLDGVEHAIDSNQEDQEELKDDLTRIEQGVKDCIDGLKKGYHKEIKEGIHEIEEREDAIGKRVSDINVKFDGIDKKLKQKSSAIQDPDKQAMLDKLKRKLLDL